MLNIKEVAFKIMKELVNGGNVEEHRAERTSVTIVKALADIYDLAKDFLFVAPQEKIHEFYEFLTKSNEEYFVYYDEKWGERSYKRREKFVELCSHFSIDEIIKLSSLHYRWQVIKTNHQRYVEEPFAYFNLNVDRYGNNVYGAYINKPDGATKTSKDKYFKLFQEKQKELVEYYNVVYYESIYVPGKRDVDNIYGKTTEATYKSRVKTIDELLKQPIPLCSEKQAFYISKYMKCSMEQAKSLNKAQAKELLDVLFGNLDHPDMVNEIMTHYKKLFGINEGKIRLEKIVKESFENVVRDFLK